MCIQLRGVRSLRAGRLPRCPDRNPRSVTRLPLVLKGVARGEDARRAVELGVAAVTESARAQSYYSSKQVQKTYQFWLFTFWLLAVPFPSLC